MAFEGGRISGDSYRDDSVFWKKLSGYEKEIKLAVVLAVSALVLTVVL